MRPVVGIDPSLRGFAVGIAGPDGVRLEEWTSQPAREVAARIARYRKLVDGAVSIVMSTGAELVLVEGYSYSSSGNSKDQSELGGILRDRLYDADPGPELLEVPPARLKKFATGKGNAGKPAMISALSRRYARDFRSDNVADAFALTQLGMVLLGQADARTKFEREVALQMAKARKAAA